MLPSNTTSWRDPYAHFDERPTATGSYRRGWATFKHYPFRLLLLALAAIIVEVPQLLLGNTLLQLFPELHTGLFEGWLPEWTYGDLAEQLSINNGLLRLVARPFLPDTVLSGLFELLIYGPVIYGLSYACLRVVEGQRPRFGDLFAAFGRRYPLVLVAWLLVGLLVGVGTVLLVVPGIVLTLRLAFVPYLLLNERRGLFDAIRESWRRSGGYFWTLVLFSIIAVPLFAAGAIAVLLGVVVSYIVYFLAHAALFAGITHHRQLVDANR